MMVFSLVRGAAGTGGTIGGPGGEAGSGGANAAGGSNSVPAAGPSLVLVPCPTFPKSTDPKCSGEKGIVGSGPTFPDNATDGVRAEIQGGFIDAAKQQTVVVIGGYLERKH